MHLVETYHYVLCNAIGQVIGEFDSLPNLHRWINQTYPSYIPVTKSNGVEKERVADKVLPSMFAIERVKVGGRN